MHNNFYCKSYIDLYDFAHFGPMLVRIKFSIRVFSNFSFIFSRQMLES